MKKKKGKRVPVAEVLKEEPKSLGRTWYPKNIDSELKGNFSALSVLSWNILAQSYVKSAYFPGTARSLLKWPTRRKAVVEALTDFIVPSDDRISVDLLCLQEVDYFTEFYRPELRRILRDKSRPVGFVFKKRTAETSSKNDGSCILYSEQRFKLVEEDHLEFNELCKDENLFELKRKRELARPAMDDKARDYFLRDCIAAVCVLEDLHTEQRLLVASVHMFWDPECTDVKILQAMLLLRKLNEIAARHDLDGVLVGGDFNSMPNSAALELLTTGRIRPEHPDAVNIPSDVVDYINNTLGDCVQIPSLLSAYSFEGKQPGNQQLCAEEISTLTKKFHGNLDYILYRSFATHSPDDEQKLVTGVFTLPTVKSCHKDRVVTLPALGHPSDHLPLLASFAIPDKSCPA